MNDKEFGSRKLLKLKYRTRDQIIHFLKNWFPPEIRSSLFILQKYQDSEKTTPESCRMHWNLMNDEEIVSIKLLKLTYRRGDQIVQTFWKIASPWKLVICGNFKSLTKKIVRIILNTWKSKGWRRIWVLESFKIEMQKRGLNNSVALQKCLVPPKKSSLVDWRNSVIPQIWFPTWSLEIEPHLESEPISEKWRKVST